MPQRLKLRATIFSKYSFAKQMRLRKRAIDNERVLYRLCKSVACTYEIRRSLNALVESYTILATMEKSGIFQDPAYKDFD
jgi:hypothetical protein